MQNKPEENKDDVSFKPIEKPDINTKVDETIQRVRDKLKLQEDIKNKPPEKGEMTTVIPPGTYAIDLNALVNAQIVNCPGTVIPMLIDHGVRTAVDIKETYKPEKRIISFKWLWAVVLFLGVMVVTYFSGMIFGLW